MTSATPALMANAIRALSMDAVEKAKSGHPGAPMGMADMAVALCGQHLQHNPANPQWANRDRFVLSNGHEDLRVIVRSRYKNCGGQNIFLAYSLTTHTLLTTWVQPPTFEWRMRKFWLYTMPALIKEA